MRPCNLHVSYVESIWLGFYGIYLHLHFVGLLTHKGEQGPILNFYIHNAYLCGVVQIHHHR